MRVRCSDGLGPGRRGGRDHSQLTPTWPTQAKTNEPQPDPRHDQPYDLWRERRHEVLSHDMRGVHDEHGNTVKDQRNEIRPERPCPAQTNRAERDDQEKRGNGEICQCSRDEMAPDRAGRIRSWRDDGNAGATQAQSRDRENHHPGRVTPYL